jgi:DNA-binding NtrC family response regulator
MNYRIPEVPMSIQVVLAVGFDPWFFEAQRAVWRTAECFVTTAGSIKEAIEHFRRGDFDLILLGHSVAAENRERLTALIRASGSQTPVVCITHSSTSHDHFAYRTVEYEPNDLLKSIGKLLANNARGLAVYKAIAVP